MPVLISNRAELQTSPEILMKRRVEPVSTVIGREGKRTGWCKPCSCSVCAPEMRQTQTASGSHQARGALGWSYFAVRTTDCRKLEAAQNPSSGYRCGIGGPPKFTCPRSYYKPVPPSRPTNFQSHLTTRGYSITEVPVLKYFTHVPFCSFRRFPRVFPQHSQCPTLGLKALSVSGLKAHCLTHCRYSKFFK